MHEAASVRYTHLADAGPDHRSGRRLPAGVVATICAVTLTACGAGQASDPASAPAPGEPTMVQPGLPGEESQVVAAGDMPDASFPHTEADVRFMQGMIHHHAQAIVMTDLARTRAHSEGVRRLALRIELSQEDEIKIMTDWLEARGEAAPTVSMEHLHHMTGDEHEFMPGMLTHEQLHELGTARGEGFDRLFLELMIQHHEGALIMVAELFASEGAAYEEEIHQFATHVEADQSIEIRRMLAMLEEFR